MNPRNSADRPLGASLAYTGGPLYIGLAHNRMRIHNSPNKNEHTVLTGWYDPGPIRSMLQVMSAKNVSTPTSKSFVIGATAPIAGGRLKAVVASFDPAGSNNNTKKVGLGCEYFLSKRTSPPCGVRGAWPATRSANTIESC